MQSSLILATIVVLAAFQTGESLRFSKTSANKASDSPPFKTFFYTQMLDHFNLKEDRTFQQRYLINDDNFNVNNGPIFFYAGNEGDIESFYNNTGFMFDIAPMFNALVIFVEHRYYGQSLPFGDDSFDDDKVQYLNVAQTLADYATFLTDFKKQNNYTDSQNPIIAFGGSYGGILAAYMRFKYPNIVQGAIAASAPIYLTAGLMPSTLFFQDVTNSFNSTAGCVPLVESAFAKMQTTYDQGNLDVLSKAFNLCKPIANQADFHHLMLWMRNAFTIMAMVNYPYPASFMGNLPAWPVEASCNLLINETKAGTELLAAFKDVAAMLYDDGSSPCFDIYAQFIECADPTSCGLGNDAKAWDFQACTELNTVQESNGVTDMFPVLPWNDQMRADYCKKTWGVNVRGEWPSVEYWGFNIKAGSNIVFSSGNLDPWHRGGPLTDLTPSLVAIRIADGAHHLDLRGSDARDPESVRMGRFQEMEQIINWIEEARSAKKQN